MPTPKCASCEMALSIAKEAAPKISCFAEHGNVLESSNGLAL